MFYRLRATWALASIFGYTVSDLTRESWNDCIELARSIEASPPDAAALFMEVCCRAVTQPDSVFVRDKLDRWIRAMRKGRLSDVNCLNIARIYAHMRGASPADADRFAERTINEWLVHDLLSADGTTVKERQFSLGLPLLGALAIEFDAQHIANMPRDARLGNAEHVDHLRVLEVLGMIREVVAERRAA